MTDQEHEQELAMRAKILFLRARELPPTLHDSFVSSEAPGNLELQSMVKSLLRSDRKHSPFESIGEDIRAAGIPLLAITGAERISPASMEGTRIDHYRLLELIGEGGFGSVYMAQQEHPVSRLVAIKVIKPGMDTKQVIARFEQERQSLAVMDHPHIARVLDAGVTDTGRPYFVMDLVKGDPIMKFSDKHKLDVKERLRLFSQVCLAIQHAHSKGIIHRDIKPSNILVTMQDGSPFAKVIDFGIVKATADGPLDKTFFTQFKQLVGTPEYMSPEQADGALDIDTRSDVYSLGVVLYELLTGSTPLDSKSLRSAAYAEIQRIIREVEPPKPSTRISASLPAAPAGNQGETKRLATIVRGDLDWIVMRCLEKDRKRRYETANELALDILMYLTGQAVSAAPPSNLYRLQKFCGRHKAIVASASLVTLALVAGLAGTGLGLKSATDANRDLEKALSQVKAEEAKAAASAARSAAVHSFFLDRMLGANDPDFSAGEDLRVRKVLDDAVHDLDGGIAPDLEAALRYEVGAVYLSLDLWKEARAQLTRSLALYEEAASPSQRDIAKVLVMLARSEQGLDSRGQAESHARRARDISLEAFGKESDEVAEANFCLAGAIYRLGRMEDARLINEAAIAEQSALHASGNETPIMARTMVMHAVEYLAKIGEHQKAAAQLRSAVAILRRNPHVESQLAWALSALGKAAAEIKQFDESDRAIDESIAIRRRLYPHGHTAIAQSLISLGINRMRQGRASKGEDAVQEAIAIYTATLGPEHEFVARSKVVLGAILASQGKWELAAQTYAQAIAIYVKLFPGDDGRTANAMSQRGGCLVELKQFEEAEKLLLDAFGMLERSKSEPAALRVTARRLVELYHAWNKRVELEQWSKRTDALEPAAK